jgi:hypothetical protein
MQRTSGLCGPTHAVPKRPSWQLQRAECEPESIYMYRGMAPASGHCRGCLDGARCALPPACVSLLMWCVSLPSDAQPLNVSADDSLLYISGARLGVATWYIAEIAHPCADGTDSDRGTHTRCLC